MGKTIKKNCLDCGIEMTLDGRQSAKQRCATCSMINTLERNKRRSRELGMLHHLVFPCGCKMLRKEAFQENKTSKSRCPVHQCISTRAYSFCKKCGAEFDVRKNYSTVCCPECRKYKKRSQSIDRYGCKPQPIRRPDCETYSKCLSTHAKSGGKMRCLKCKKYRATKLDILAYVAVGDSFSKTGMQNHGKEIQ